MRIAPEYSKNPIGDEMEERTRLLLAAFILTFVLVFGISACSNAEQDSTTITEVHTGQMETLGRISDITGLNEAHDISFKFDTKTVTLNSGYEMPIYGIGTYSLLNEECVSSVSAALENGVRLIH